MYADLNRNDLPKILTQALLDYGVKEKPGPGSNDLLLDWAKDLGIKGYNSDDIPWCGLAVAHWVAEAGWPIVEQPLWARNWLRWGILLKEYQDDASPDFPSLGDILVWGRPGGGGHVGPYAGHDATHFHCLGGNQGDEVNFRRFTRSMKPSKTGMVFLGAVRPNYRNRPLTARPVKRSAKGAATGGSVV